MLANREVTPEAVDMRTLPPPPECPLSYWQKLRAMRDFHTGHETVRDAGGPVTSLTMGPQWLVPRIVAVSSPQGGRDMLGRTDASVDKLDYWDETRKLVGGNLLNLAHTEWLPRRRSLQHVFTKPRVRDFSDHMVQMAERTCENWADGESIDLNAECRLLTLRALGRSIFGLDLDADIEKISSSHKIALYYTASRAGRPVRAPSWLPTPARRRARRASGRLHDLARNILFECRRDPDRNAPLVRALMDTKDPETGRYLSDDEICHDLVVFMLAGYDTTSTTLTYALWQLGRHPAAQDRVRAEVHALGPGNVTVEVLPQLPYTNHVVQESLRLCPPVSAIPRTAVRDIEVDGYRVAAGTVLAYGVWAVHRDPTLWTDPLAFDPDRFEPARAKQLDRWQYLPFGAGPRTCIGTHFATLQMILAVATVIGHARLSSAREDFPISAPITIQPAGPVPALVSKFGDSPKSPTPA